MKVCLESESRSLVLSPTSTRRSISGVLLTRRMIYIEAQSYKGEETLVGVLGERWQQRGTTGVTFSVLLYPHAFSFSWTKSSIRLLDFRRRPSQFMLPDPSLSKRLFDNILEQIT